jgi:hypothetical protein
MTKVLVTPTEASALDASALNASARNAPTLDASGIGVPAVRDPPIRPAARAAVVDRAPIDHRTSGTACIVAPLIVATGATGPHVIAGAAVPGLGAAGPGVPGHAIANGSVSRASVERIPAISGRRGTIRRVRITGSARGPAWADIAVEPATGDVGAEVVEPGRFMLVVVVRRTAVRAARRLQPSAFRAAAGGRRSLVARPAIVPVVPGNTVVAAPASRDEFGLVFAMAGGLVPANHLTGDIPPAHPPGRRLRAG